MTRLVSDYAAARVSRYNRASPTAAGVEDRMALTKFVRNVEDISDDGGYKFRFRCDQCSDGFESLLW